MPPREWEGADALASGEGPLSYRGGRPKGEEERPKGTGIIMERPLNELSIGFEFLPIGRDVQPRR